MTDQRHEPASLADDTVSRTYREVAGERAPERLDRAILAEAARAARPRYARSRAWTRPVAWAATVALTVAIVLELTRLPVPEEVPFDLDAPALGDAGADTPAVPAAAEEEAPASIAPGRSNDVVPKTPEKTSLMQKTAAPMAAEGEAEGPQQEAAVPELATEPAAAPVDAADFEVKDKNLLDRADEMAEMEYLRAREERAAAVPAARFQAGALTSSAEDCPEEVRGDPNDWLTCIEGLDEAGLEAQADEQRRLLREAFPDFDVP